VPVRLRICSDNGSTPRSSTTEVRVDPDARVEVLQSSSIDSFFGESDGELLSCLGDANGL
jgi:hypothetical protein